MFQLTEYTEAHVASITNRVERHGDDEKPAVSIGLEITAANDLLDAIDPALRGSMFVPKPDDEPELDGIRPSTPILRCNSIERTVLTTKHEGWTLTIDSSVREEEDYAMTFGGVKVDKLSVEPKQGGSIVLRLRLGTSDVDADRLGWLAMHNGESIWVKLIAPEPGFEPAEEEDDDDGPTAEDLFAAGGDAPPSGKASKAARARA